jgi:hypothetical protein
MTDAKAEKAIRFWGAKVAKSDFTAKDEDGRIYLTTEGEIAKSFILPYDEGVVRRAMASVRNSQQWPTWAHVKREVQGAEAPRRQKCVPEDWISFGHGRVVEFRNGDFGIVELECQTPVIHMLQTFTRPDGSELPPDWTVLSAERWRFGMAGPVSGVKQEELLKTWRKMDDENQLYNQAPLQLLPPEEKIVPGSAIGTVPQGDELF